MKMNIMIFPILILLSATLLSPSSYGMSENDKIRHLLREIEISGYTFIRNGNEYPSRKAREHLEFKLKRAGKKIKTAGDFIRKIASRSSFSGKPYYIRMKSGRIIKTEEWLKAKLKELENRLNSR